MQQSTPPNSSPIRGTRPRVHFAEEPIPAPILENSLPSTPGKRQQKAASTFWHATPDDSPEIYEQDPDASAVTLSGVLHTSKNKRSTGSSIRGHDALQSSPTISSGTAPHHPVQHSMTTRSGKERRPPSITPRKFRKFFTPRGSSLPSVTRSALHDITRSSLNQSHSSTASQPKELFADIPRPANPASSKRSTGLVDHDLGDDVRPAKRQNISRLNGLHPPSGSSVPTTLPTTQPPQPRDLRVLLKHMGVAGHVFQRELGDIDRAFDVLSLSHPVIDWRTHTADFCSSFDYVHSTAQAEAGQPRATIFSQASCHTNNMVLIGDDLGTVRLLDTDVPGEGGFKQCHLRWRAHDNAVTDVAMSADDLRAATASADRTGMVWDMMSQKPLTLLGCGGSVKSIRFQPGAGGGNVLATSSRDGLVHVWDLRCKNGRINDWQNDDMDTSIRINESTPINSFYSTHTARDQHQHHNHNHQRVGNTVVTTLEFLPAGKEHLVLSTCEANATIKLWDIRALRHHEVGSKNASKPVSCVSPPAGHSAHRHYGVSSMALGTDGARLYALCKDNTVYAYSTAHLALGHAPELESGKNLLRRRSSPVHEGLAPLYGFRHALFTSPTFYVRCAVRPARDGNAELLAVGSGYGTPVLFPTDERYLHTQLDLASAAAASSAASNGAFSQDMAGPIHTVPSSSVPTQAAASWTDDDEGSWGGVVASTRHVQPRPREDTPIFTCGTPLVHGHAKEATSVSFTRSGALVSASDDCTARVWGEDRERARRLRTGGWSGGQRWGRGWASVGADYDEVGDDEF